MWDAGARGPGLVQVAPMRAQRMRAAGPGRFSARLRMRVPFSGWGAEEDMGGMRRLKGRVGGVIAGDCGTLPAVSFKRLYINCYRCCN